MLELLIDNRNGNVWDVSEIVEDVQWSTSRIGKPGSLDFVLIKGALYQSNNFQYNNGDVVRFRYKDQNVFYGYIFNIDEGKDEAVRIKAYDQIRFLSANDTYVLSGVTATDIVKLIASDFGLKTGALIDTGYRIPALSEDNKKLIDIICKALDLTLINSGRNFVLYDDFGQLVIRNIEDMRVDFILSDDSLMTDYVSSRSIDSDTYNRVKLVRDNEKTGKRDVHITQDSSNIARWGMLQLYQTVDENMNDAQIREMLDMLITVKNRESKSIKLQAIGDIRLRAGCYVPVQIAEYEINQYFLVDSCTHSINDTEHTMSIELKVI